MTGATLRGVLLGLCLLAAAQAAEPCHVATRDGEPCPTNDAISIAEYLSRSSGVLPFSYAASMDETAWLDQQAKNTQAPRTTSAPVPRTPGPTPGGVHYFKDCTHVTCEWIDDHHVIVYHSHLEKHGPYHRWGGI
jgi:hypothetical protein